MKPSCIHLMILMMVNNLAHNLISLARFLWIYGAEHLNMTIPNVGGI